MSINNRIAKLEAQAAKPLVTRGPEYDFAAIPPELMQRWNAWCEKFPAPPSGLLAHRVDQLRDATEADLDEVDAIRRELEPYRLRQPGEAMEQPENNNEPQ